MGYTTVRCPRSPDPFHPQHTVPTVKQVKYVVVWVRFSGKMGRAGLYFLPKNKSMNADAYLQVLQEHMLNLFYIYECEVFMQNSAPCYKVKQVNIFFEEQQIDLFE